MCVRARVRVCVCARACVGGVCVWGVGVGDGGGYNHRAIHV